MFKSKELSVIVAVVVVYTRWGIGPARFKWHLPAILPWPPHWTFISYITFCLFSVNWTFNKLQWKFNENTKLFFKKINLKMSSEKWQPSCSGLSVLTHWGRMRHICVGKLTIIGSANGLSPGRRQAIIWTNAGILLIGTLGTNFSEILKWRLRNGVHYVSASMC